jgi:hypothetical protein
MPEENLYDIRQAHSQGQEYMRDELRVNQVHTLFVVVV